MTTVTAPRTLIVDGDMVAWSIAWHPDNVASRACACVRKYLRELEADRAVVCFSDPSRRYWRHDLMPSYKPHPSDPPKGLGDAKAALAAEFPSRTIPGLEADDVIGIVATHPGVRGERVIVARDKDLRTIPGPHYDPHAETRGTVVVGERDADFNHMVQSLVGDSSDGYPGCPGIGEKKVRRILWGEPRQWWGQVVCAFKGRGLTADDALLQARVARICRATDYDFEAKRVIPWEPPVAAELAGVSR